MYNVAKAHSFADTKSGCGMQTPPSRTRRICQSSEGKKNDARGRFQVQVDHQMSHFLLGSHCPSHWIRAHFVWHLCGIYLLAWAAQFYQATYRRHRHDHSPPFLHTERKMWHSQAYIVFALSCFMCQLTLSRFKQYSVGYYVLQLHQKNPKCRGYWYTSGVCSENSVPSACMLSLFSSLLVGVRVDFTLIRVVADKTGCHRFACNVSWAWFLLWAGSAALHFYSSPPETIPCVNIGCGNSPMHTIFR